MEELFIKQKKLVDEIERIATNFGKDSSSRKTVAYIQGKLADLDKAWTEFAGNHLKLLTSEVKSHDYFTLNVHDNLKQRYENIREALVSYRPGIQGEKYTPIQTEEKSTSSRADDLKCQQRTNFRAFLRVVRSINIDTLKEKWEMEDKLQMLHMRWKAIDELHWQIDNLLMGSDLAYEDEYTEHEISYEEAKKTLNKKLNSTTHQHQSTPKIEIPTFSGSYSQWPTFMDLFTETIHNNPNLTNAQKMQHLKGKLKGEAERLVQHLYITAENYETCWDILTYRYNNTQLLFTKHIQLLMNQPTVQKQTTFELKRLYDTSMEAVHAIQNLGVDTTTWDPILVHIITEKMDSETYTSYMEARKTPRNLPVFDELMSFIEGKFTALEPLSNKAKKTTVTPSHRPAASSSSFNTYKQIGHKQEYKPPIHGFKSKNYTSYHTTSGDRNCPICKTDHILFYCKAFHNMSPETKVKTIEELRVCRNCLYCHDDKPCNSKKRCKVCSGTHHTVLHDLYKLHSLPTTTKSLPTSTTRASYIPNTTPSSNHVANQANEVLLSTVIIKVKAKDGSYMEMRALVDQGSQISLITENAAQRLGLQRRRHSGTISGVGTLSNKSKGLVELCCTALDDDYSFTTEALVMTTMLNNLPSYTFTKQDWPHMQGIKLADPDYNLSRPVDILLDASVYSNIVLEGLLRGPAQSPIAQQTRIGWILFGNVKTFNCHVVLNNLDELAQYWDMEEISTNTDTTLTADEEYCERLYQTTTTRAEDGRYKVRLPMKQGFEKNLGPSKAQAVAQFLNLEKRMSKDKLMHEQYKTFIEDYIQKGHMKLCMIPQTPSYFLPHHGVLRPDSSTTKLRVVFNGSAKTQTGYSLNELMHPGANLQQELLSMILRWRKYKYVYTADIEQFYRQILVHEEDQHLQKIVWRESVQQPLKDYTLCTVSYGTRAAPYLAMRTIKQLVQDDGEMYPLACETLNNQLYVDDLLGGQNNIDLAQQTQQQLINILHAAGFNLRKWASNDPRLLENLSEEQVSVSMLDFKHTQSNKTLGLRWNPQTDEFTFQQKMYCKDDVTANITKRSLLSDMSKLYDPLGWLSPVNIKAKLIFQNVWKSGVSWDEPLTNNIQQEWEAFRSDIPNIDKVVIPRWIGDTSRPIQIYGFCDASEKAYSGVIYCKTITENGEPDIRLIAAKTKLAPLNKIVSIPRLELCGALLLSRLMKKVTESLSGHDVTIYGYTDSMVVLGYLKGDVSRWKAFVANRVTEIVKNMPSSCWNHVSSEDNPADCASRGLSPTQLLARNIWWSGPAWLKEDIVPQQKQIIEVPTLELRKQRICATQTYQEPNIIQELINKYSSITKLIRVTCWISRFLSNTRHIENATNTTYLTTNEIQRAQIAIMKIVQLTFNEDILRLKQKGTVHRKSNLLSLNPFVDEDGLLRVGGRLKYSQLQKSAKHPIILPKQHKVSELLIDQAHKMTLHAGAKLTLGYLRNKYWVLGGNRRVKNQLKQCVKCIRFKPSNNNQLMADLPEPRVTPSRAFTHCGVDFTGQVEVKANKGRGIKTTLGYIAVFVCLSTKAVHLELVSDLSSATFLAAFKRMCGRRGQPKHMYSDNGRNFVKAAKVLVKEQREATQAYIDTEFMDYIASQGIQWHFTAPSWPSSGGIWETGVMALKRHLKPVLGEQKLTYEEFTTLLTQIEACLNSRPLTPLTEDCDDLDCLTPGHFLAGGPILATQAGTDIHDLRNRWQLTERMLRDFWKRWSTEYLHTLQTRSKWHLKKPNIAIGEIVLIKEDNAPPARWLLGKVQELHPGKDGLVRVVTLKTKMGTSKRPIVKLAPLSVRADTDIPTQPTASNSDSDNIPKTTRGLGQTIKPAPRLVNYILSTLLIFTMLISPSVQQLFNITTLDTAKPVYFDKIANMHIIQDEWNIVVYYNLSTYTQSLDNINKYVTHLKSKCTSNTAFLTIATQLEHEINELQHNNQLLQTEQQTRKKRGLINGVGYLANSLFGLLDERFARKYEIDIKLLRQNQQHLQKLYKEQTTIIEGEYNVLKRNEEVMNKQHTLINQHLAELQGQQVRLETAQNSSAYIISGTLAATVIISNLHRIQDSLLDMITDLRNGKIDIHLLRPDELLQQLNVISRQISNDMTLPNFSTEQNVRNIYKILHVHSRLTSEFLVFEVKIPLLNTDKYELHRMIPIPQKRQNNTIAIVPTTEYIALNLRKDMFIMIYSEQLHTCLIIDEDQLLCPLRQPIYNLKGTGAMCEAQIINNGNITRCETEIRQCGDKWIQLHNGDAWLYACCEECTVRIFCADGVAAKPLRGTGLITMGQGCLLKHDSFTIPAHLRLRSNLIKSSDNEIRITMPHLPDINAFINSSTNRLIVPESHAETLNKIHQNIEIIKQHQEKLDTEDSVTIHDIHQYTLLYVIIAIGLAILVYKGSQKIRERCGRVTIGHSHDTAEIANNDIEMQSIRVRGEKISAAKPAQPARVDMATSPKMPRESLNF